MQQGEADDVQELLYKELERTPHHGPQFAKAIRSLMHHEDQWADWKAGSAHSFERPKREVAAQPSPPKRRRLNPTDTIMMGTRELTRCGPPRSRVVLCHSSTERARLPI